MKQEVELDFFMDELVRIAKANSLTIRLTDERLEHEKLSFINDHDILFSRILLDMNSRVFILAHEISHVANYLVLHGRTKAQREYDANIGAAKLIMSIYARYLRVNNLKFDVELNFQAREDLVRQLASNFDIRLSADLQSYWPTFDNLRQIIFQFEDRSRVGELFNYNWRARGQDRFPAILREDEYQEFIDSNYDLSFPWMSWHESYDLGDDAIRIDHVTGKIALSYKALNPEYHRTYLDRLFKRDGKLTRLVDHMEDLHVSPLRTRLSYENLYIQTAYPGTGPGMYIVKNDHEKNENQVLFDMLNPDTGANGKLIVAPNAIENGLYGPTQLAVIGKRLGPWLKTLSKLEKKHVPTH
ncbi:hypothetical protein EQG49_12625 [Periweissella cryptocerci]|uniref:Uncharacterized protein n=1 Tax=Periweissella cryptocerci TaxID=2506420 RepID=A0A4P6YWK7_9LACO|nr:hypothetical protein [Periweissella cryptocerci]QBO37242.1 hypothetical protein EQG49_12625 [Periweissella cryptocerci]